MLDYTTMLSKRFD